MLGIGAGGPGVAGALGGGPFLFHMPKVVRVHLTGALQPWVTAKDVILELLRRLTVRGGTGKIFEYGGPRVPRPLGPPRMAIPHNGGALGPATRGFPRAPAHPPFLTPLGPAGAWA